METAKNPAWPMRFEVHSSLPPLAWLANISPNTITVHHGHQVETHANGFFEGVWEGNFRRFDYADSAHVFGSGGALAEETFTIVPPSHMYEYVYLIKRGNSVFCSNSLPFLLHFHNADLKTNLWTYGSLFASLTKGIEHLPVQIPTTIGPVSIYFYCNIHIDRLLRISHHPKPRPAAPQNFAAYRQGQIDLLRAVAANGHSPARQVSRFTLLSTLSAGYDSPVCAALMKEAGGMKAVTVVSARNGQNDSGVRIGKILDLDVKEFIRNDPLTDTDCIEAQFLASGMQGEDLVFSVFRDELPGSILLTGSFGDSLWDKNLQGDSTLRLRSLACTGFGEFRLRQGFAHLPLPATLARQREAIHALSNHPEMEPFSIGGDYDRPLARRILYQAGIPTTAFAQHKSAITVRFYRHSHLLSAATRRDIRSFNRMQRYGLLDRLRYAGRALHWYTGFSVFIAYKLVTKALRKNFDLKLEAQFSRVFSRLFGSEFHIFEHAHPKHTVWVRWAIHRLRQDYAISEDTSHAQHLFRHRTATARMENSRVTA